MTNFPCNHYKLKKSIFPLLLVAICMYIVLTMKNKDILPLDENVLFTEKGLDLVNRLPQPECIDCIQVNRSMKIKGFGTFTFPEPNCYGKLLVYECLSGDLCGGLADRQKGIMSAFLIALLTNRTFVLNHRKSCDTKKIIPPRVYNWYKCMSYLKAYEYKGERVVDYIDRKGSLPDDFSAFSSGDIWSEHIVKVRLNTRLNGAIKGHPDAKTMLPWLFTSKESEILSGLMKILFQLEENLNAHLTNFLRNHTMGGEKKLIAAHIRTRFLDVENDLPLFFSFLSKYNNTSKYVIYVATDSVEVRKRCERIFPNMVSLNTSIVHIDEVKKACDGMYTAVFEQHVIASADVLLLTESGFSRIATFIRDRQDGIFLFRGRDGLTVSHFEQLNLDELAKRFPIS